MQNLEVDNRGNVNVVLALVTTAIVLYVAAIVIGKLSSLNATLTGCDIVADPAATTTAACKSYVMLNNLTSLTTNALTIASIGLLILAAVGILSYFGIGFGGARKGRK